MSSLSKLQVVDVFNVELDTEEYNEVWRSLTFRSWCWDRLHMEKVCHQSVQTVIRLLASSLCLPSLEEHTWTTYCPSLEIPHPSL